MQNCKVKLSVFIRVWSWEVKKMEEEILAEFSEDLEKIQKLILREKKFPKNLSELKWKKIQNLINFFERSSSSSSLPQSLPIWLWKSSRFVALQLGISSKASAHFLQSRHDDGGNTNSDKYLVSYLICASNLVLWMEV